MLRGLRDRTPEETIDDLTRNNNVHTIKIFKMKLAVSLFLVITDDFWITIKLNK